MVSKTPSSLSGLVDSRFSESALRGGSRVSRLQDMDSELENLQQSLYQILATVFEYLQPLWRPRRNFIEPGGNSEVKFEFRSGWMCITHVCSHWREVALSVPSLWSKPSIDILSVPHQCIPDILVRSRSASLKLEMDYDEDSTLIRAYAGLNAWLTPAVLRRTRCLMVAADEELVNHVAERLPPSEEMEQLQALTVMLTLTDGLPDLPAAFHELSGVTELTLWGFWVPWQCPLMSSKLTKLTLLFFDDDTPRPYYEGFRALLSLLQSLVDLNITNLVPLTDPDNSQPHPISLPSSMRRITVHVTCSRFAMDALTLISLMHPPPLCACDYSLPSSPYDAAQANDAMARLLSLLSSEHRDTTEAQDLQLRHGHLKLMSAVIAPPSPPLHQSPWPNAPQIPATLDMQTFSLANYMSFLTMRDLRTVSFDGTSIQELSRDKLWATFLRAANVRQIGIVRLGARMFDCTHTELFNTLRTSCSFGDGTPSGIFFPQLEVLALPFTNDESTYANTVFELIELIHARRDRGSPLRELIISREAEDWAVWHTLRRLLKVTFIDYPTYESPIMPQEA
ncbi:unnamed protein product [Peniophora sp. CBMAI 1063]|nr:unnamed protein product [Peniophora sp. CBMAI 1063]